MEVSLLPRLPSRLVPVAESCDIMPSGAHAIRAVVLLRRAELREEVAVSTHTAESPGGTVDPAADAGAVGRKPARRKHPWRVSVAVYLVTAFALISLNFFLPRLMPGSPIDGLFAAGSQNYVYDAQTRAKLEAYYGLDRPLLTQYGAYLGGLVTGDLGRSIDTGEPVATTIKRDLPWTLLLIGAATVLSTAVGVVAGVHTGWHRGGRVDKALVGGFTFLGNFPAYVLGSLVAFVFAVKVQWLPLAGAQTPFASYGPLGTVGDVAYHLIGPGIVLALGLASYQYLLTRASMIGELGSDYLLLGRAKGLTERRLKYRYAGRNALLPVASATALQLGTALVLTIVIERIFAYPGLGREFFGAIGSRDYPLLQGCFLVFTLMVLTTNLVADLLYRRLDPRTTA